MMEKQDIYETMNEIKSHFGKKLYVKVWEFEKEGVLIQTSIGESPTYLIVSRQGLPLGSLTMVMDGAQMKTLMQATLKECVKRGYVQNLDELTSEGREQHAMAMLMTMLDEESFQVNISYLFNVKGILRQCETEEEMSEVLSMLVLQSANGELVTLEEKKREENDSY